jgi:transcriptional regulator with XRE-family HTH domain
MRDDVRPAAVLLRQLRTQKGASLRQAASEIGIAPSHLSRLERGEKGSSADVAARAAAYYGIEPENLTPPPVPVDIATILHRHPEIIEELRNRYDS